jgi:NAD(P)-dependent dehydrogenase (short-subunit alcohol dehydrogenase family)
MHEVLAMVNSNKVWFITGISRGFGKALAEAALLRGDTVIGTSRNGKCDIEQNAKKLHVLPLDVTDRFQVESTIKEAFELYNRLDVVVNNAGYGLLGAIEETSAGELNDVMEVNFFGTVNVIQTVLPYLRQQRSGHILNLSSIAGLAPIGGYAFYAAAKFAVEGLSISLADEVRHLGIKVTAIEPGAFRTDFLADSSIRYSSTKIDDYSGSSAVDRFKNMDGKQIGDPTKAVKAMLEIVDSSEPPLHLVLGSDAYKRTSAHLAAFGAELEKWKHLTLSTDFAEVTSK